MSASSRELNIWMRSSSVQWGSKCCSLVPLAGGLSLGLSLSLSGGNEPSFKRCFVYICPSLRSKHNTSLSVWRQDHEIQVKWSLFQVSYQVLLLYQWSFLFDSSGRLQREHLWYSQDQAPMTQRQSPHISNDPMTSATASSTLFSSLPLNSQNSDLLPLDRVVPPGWRPYIAQGCRGASIWSTMMCLLRAALLVYSPSTLAGNCFRVALRVKYVTFT